MPATKSEEKLIKQLFESQPDSVVWFEPEFSVTGSSDEVEDFKIAYYNTAAERIFNISKTEFTGQSLKQNPVFEEETRIKIFEQCLHVWKTGEPSELVYYNEILDKYFKVQRSKILDGVLSITRDRTSLVRAELEKEKQSQLFNRLIENAPYGVCLYNTIRNEDNDIIDFKISVCNHKSCEIVGSTYEELNNKSMKEFTEARGAPSFFNNCVSVIESGKPLNIDYFSQTLHKWISFSIIKFEDGVLLNFIDITTNKEQTEELNSILDASISGVCAYEVVKDNDGEIIDFTFIRINKWYTEMIGMTADEVEGKNLLTLFPHSVNTGFFASAKEVMKTGTPSRIQTYYNADNLDAWYDLSLVKMGDSRLVVTFSDITETVESKKSVEKLAAQLKTIIDTTQTGICLMTPIFNDLGEITDYTIKVANRKVEQYGNVAAGAMENTLVSQWFEAFKESGLFDLYCDTYRTGKQTQKYIHYTGKIDIWMDALATRIEDDLLVTFHDYTPLKNLQEQLEQSISELKRSNENLSEFAYAASHDLQEPLRKINVFSVKLRKDLEGVMTEESSKVFERMESAALRMSQLINDLLAYSQLSTKRAPKEDVALSEVVQYILTDFEAVIAEKNAVIEIADLPTIKGDQVQLRQLFQNLFSNSLKYSKQSVSPVINIKYQVIKKDVNGEKVLYHEINFSDNGIGFDQEHSERIFRMFQRLHGRSEYPGTGVGLAIAYKVVENHLGTITAAGRIGEGATFTILFPVQVIV